MSQPKGTSTGQIWGNWSFKMMLTVKSSKLLNKMEIHASNTNSKEEKGPFLQ
jgi:hypothetical protein